jgi:hypothetical protein
VNTTATDTDGVTGTGIENADGNVTFFYGRVHAPRTRITGSTGAATFYYEIYCFGTDSSGISCDPLLRDSITGGRLSTDDIRWFQNSNHTNADGTISNTTERSSLTKVNINGTIINAATTTIPYLYNDTEKGYPYKATMEINASSWLRYNKFIPDPALFNDYELEFSSVGGWSGTDQSGANVDSNASINTNRRIQW